MKKVILSLILTAAFLCASVWCFADETEIILPQRSEIESIEIISEETKSIEITEAENDEETPFGIWIEESKWYSPLWNGDNWSSPPHQKRIITDSNGVEQPEGVNDETAACMALLDYLLPKEPSEHMTIFNSEKNTPAGNINKTQIDSFVKKTAKKRGIHVIKQGNLPRQMHYSNLVCVYSASEYYDPKTKYATQNLPIFAGGYTLKYNETYINKNHASPKIKPTKQNRQAKNAAQKELENNINFTDYYCLHNASMIKIYEFTDIDHIEYAFDEYDENSYYFRVCIDHGQLWEYDTYKVELVDGLWKVTAQVEGYRWIS